MNQLNLFDNEPDQTGFYGQPVLARKSDPPTSHMAARDAAIKASETHKLLASWLAKQTEPQTCREIAEGAKKSIGLPQEVETLRKRAGELEDIPESVLGFDVRIAGTRKCNVTGKLAETWSVR